MVYYSKVICIYIYIYIYTHTHTHTLFRCYYAMVLLVWHTWDHIGLYVAPELKWDTSAVNQAQSVFLRELNMSVKFRGSDCSVWIVVSASCSQHFRAHNTACLSMILKPNFISLPFFRGQTDTFFCGVKNSQYVFIIALDRL